MKLGQKVMQIIVEDIKERIYYGIVIRSADPESHGVRVQWHKGYSTWEKICNLIEVEDY